MGFDERKFLSGVALKNYRQKKKILKILCDSGNSSIAEVSKSLGLSIPKTTALVAQLEKEGLVKESGKEESSGGRPPNIYGLTTNSIYFIGVDFRGDHLRIGAIDFTGSKVDRVIHIEWEYEDSSDNLSLFIRHVVAAFNKMRINKRLITGIGINIDGRVNVLSNSALKFYDSLQELAIYEIESKLGVPVFLENDSRAMAYAEYYLSPKSSDNFLYININKGIGMGMFLNGELFYGRSGFAGEFGHMPIYENNILCQCGKIGCLETEASGNALISIFKEKIDTGNTTTIDTSKKIGLSAIIEGAISDDVLAIELIDRIGRKLGRGIAHLINVFNPEKVVLGGPLSLTQEYLRLPVKSAINKYSLSMINNDTELLTATIQKDASVQGSALLVREKYLSS